MGAFYLLNHYKKCFLLNDFLSENHVLGFTIEASNIPNNEFNEECGGLVKNLYVIKEM
jgi:hypothetical protein